jgi:fluoride exporter
VKFLLVAFGGGLGAAARYGVNLWADKITGDFPWATLIVNVLGCFAMGVITMLAATRLNLSAEMRLFLMTGILGGFTTFSAFAADFASLLERDAITTAGVYVATSVILSLAAVLLGITLVRALSQ